MKKEYKILTAQEGAFPMGVVRTEGGIHAAFVSGAQECALLLFQKGKKRAKRLVFPQEGRKGNVWAMTVLGDFEDMDYCFEADGEEVADPYGRGYCGRARFGVKKAGGACPRALFAGEETFDWEGDAPVFIPYEESIIYRIHVRGFTRHASSGVAVKDRGTFKAVAEKIPYFKELGITTLELMPVCEFDEAGEGRVNYWGYKNAFSFAPKAAYSSAEGKEPGEGAVTEFKSLIKALHKEKLEVIMELYFDGSLPDLYVLEAARYWAGHFHVDGLHFVGQVPLKLLAEDPFLARTKLLAGDWGDIKDPYGKRRLAVSSDAFLTDMRGFLTGDSGKLSAAAFRIRNNPQDRGVINYMAHTNGFTLMDMVCFDEKHNEANGEDGRDGADYNFSWNCGAEGPVRNRKINELRKRQLRNALLLLFLSQGTPLLMMGDEFGRTQKGNNNAYCQDNEVSWLNWKLLKTNAWLYDFARFAIAFRKEHGVFHREKEPALTDTKGFGLPEFSYHQSKAWYTELYGRAHHLGVFYCGKFAKKPDGGEDDYIYVAYNMHWKPNVFGLPDLPKGLEWGVVVDTSNEAENGIPGRAGEGILRVRHELELAPRTVAVLIGMEVPETGQTAQESGHDPDGDRKEVRHAPEGETDEQAVSTEDIFLTGKETLSTQE